MCNVGINADVILASYKPFNSFVCATKDAKLRRCFERNSINEKINEKDLICKMQQIDKIRS